MCLPACYLIELIPSISAAGHELAMHGPLVCSIMTLWLLKTFKFAFYHFFLVASEVDNWVKRSSFGGIMAVPTTQYQAI